MASRDTQPFSSTLPVAPSPGRIVARRTGHAAVGRQAAIEKESLAEARRGRIVGDSVREIGRRRRQRRVMEDLPHLLRRKLDLKPPLAERAPCCNGS